MNGDPSFQDIVRRESDIRDPGPSLASVIWDENEESINNGGFYISPSTVLKWEDWPATRHNLGCTMSFADGHVEYWKWKGPWVLHFTGWGVPASPQDQDLARVHTTVGAN